MEIVTGRVLLSMRARSTLAAILFSISLPTSLIEARLLNIRTQASVNAHEVPIVGCRSDGQQGPQRAPTGKTLTVSVDAAIAQQLAYYKAEYGPGVLAPRGWHCFGTYGSSGSSLYVSPEVIDSKLAFSSTWRGFAENAIQFSVSDGGTSGRFAVAEIIARVFPSRKAFVDSVTAEGPPSPSSFPSGPYPEDKLIYRNERIVEYLTPAHSEGFGTHSRMQPGERAIRGTAILSGSESEPNLSFLAMRLPSELTYLEASIIHQAETDGSMPER